MTIKSYFPTHIYSEKVEASAKSKLNKELLIEAYQLQKVDKAGANWSKTNYVGGYTSYSSYSELHRLSSTFMEFEKKIDKHVKKFSKFLEYDLHDGTLYMSECWINIMPANTTHSMHIHPLSVISGTYYVKTPKNCSDIKFEDPRADKFMAAPPKKEKHSDKNKAYISHAAKAGNVVLFESWLRHGVEASLIKDDRISISFNYNWG